MCDELTETEAAAWLLSRRAFTALGAGAATLGALPGCAAALDTPLASRSVVIETADGKADAFFVHPAQGRHPAVIMWPDIAGLRDAYKAMASRLAASGYAVLAVNQYYRSAATPILGSLMEWRTPAGQEKLKPMIAAITPAGTVADAAAFVRWLDQQAEVDTARRIGSCGYCMGGPFAVRTAFANPVRVGAAASFHGAGLAGDSPDSPINLLPRTNAAYLIAIAENDDARAPDEKTKLRVAADTAGRPAEIEVYPAQHGWCTIDAPVYDKAQADRAWDRMLALYQANL